jgi:lipoprotein-anchoring transpeptidase ErfK/SrfK
MSGLRTLALCFLVSASAFSLAAALQTRPELKQELFRLAGEADRRLWRPALAYARGAIKQLDPALLDAPPSHPGARAVVMIHPPTPQEERMAAARIELPPIERPGMAEPLIMDAPIEIAPDLPDVGPVAIPLPPAPPRQQAQGRPAPRIVTPPPQPQARIAPEPRAAQPQTSAPGIQRQSALTRDQARARARLVSNLTPVMRQNFDLFLYVSKSAEGPLAQRMYVFRKEGNELTLLHDWAASTGRERSEISPRGVRSFTGTPAGFYQFDPGRMYTRYHSYSWDQPMPHAMFFNWRRQGVLTGLAVHAAHDETISKLGSRASAGCVHLAPENARALFNLVRAEYRGQVPRFAVDRNDTMSNTGRFSRNADGSLRMASGYKVLINIEDYSGAGNDALADVIF